ncbi:mitochondrial carrier domain-containing protein [Kalaharituber pfeilii]|nr:mitochondrial carrier domain-containing protein [Kalaharituber pfeilii]
MSTTGFAATPAEYEDETRGIVTSPASSEHHIHHHHHREGRSVNSNGDGGGVQTGSGQIAIVAGPVESGSESKKFVITPAQQMLSACSGSLLTSLLVTPLDVVRVRLQAQAQPSTSLSTPINPADPATPPSTTFRVHRVVSPQYQSTFARLPSQLGVTACCREVFWVTNHPEFCIASSSPASTATPAAILDACAVEETAQRRFTGTWEGLVKIARYEGIPSLWRGLSPTLLMTIPANVIYFTGYDTMRQSPNNPFNAFGPHWSALLCGGSARAIAATAISPLELFRTRLWAISTPRKNVNGEAIQEHNVFRKTISGLVDMVKVEGWTSLWRGLTLTLWRDVPFSGIYWTGYEIIKGRLKAQHKQQDTLFSHPHPSKKMDSSANTFTDSFLAGALAGSIASFLTTPFDVGKTRIQVNTNRPPPEPTGPTAVRAGFAPGHNGVYKSMPSLLYGIFKAEGVRGLWRGCVPRLLKVAPACAIMISSYEVGKQWAEKINQRKLDKGLKA